MTVSKRGHRDVESNCPYHYAFRYGAAVGVKSSCTNVPIHCPHCDSGSRKLTIWKYNALGHIQATHSDLIPHGLNKTLRLDVQITHQEELKMRLKPESVEEFRAAKCSLLLGDAELSSLKSEVEAAVPPSRKSKRSSRHADTPTVIVKRKANPADLEISTIPMKKTKGS